MDVEQLWEAYWASRTDEARNRLVERHMGLAVRFAKTRAKRTGGEWRDVLSAASQGLMEAVAKFSLDRGVKFSTFAWTVMFRRSVDWERSMRSQTKRMKRFTDIRRDFSDVPCE